MNDQDADLQSQNDELQSPTAHSAAQLASGTQVLAAGNAKAKIRVDAETAALTTQQAATQQAATKNSSSLIALIQAINHHRPSISGPPHQGGAIVVGPWGGFSNGNIPVSAMLNVEGQWFEPETAGRVVWAVAEIRRRGGSITINEGYRPLGVPSDQYVPQGSPERTSTGGSDQWFQRGRANRGETPSAGVPGTSVHGWGEAGDFDYGNGALVREVFARAGLVFTIRSESWHADSSGTPAG